MFKHSLDGLTGVDEAECLIILSMQKSPIVFDVMEKGVGLKGISLAQFKPAEEGTEHIEKGERDTDG